MARRQELEQHVTQLETQIAQLNAELGALRAQVNTLTEQNNELTAQRRDHAAQIESYRSREQAVVYALTEAKETTSRRIAEAEDKARQIVKDAEAQKYVAQRQAETIERDANARANTIIENAKREAADTLAQMQDAARDVDMQLQRLNSALRDTAERARRQAGEFANAINGLRTDDKPPQGGAQYASPAQDAQAAFDLSMLADGEDAFTAPAEKSSQLDFSAVLPKEEGDPQKLIRNIYQMQGRDIPPSATQSMDTRLQADQELDSVLDELTQQSAVERPPAPSPLPGYQPVTPTAPEPPEERLWTVDEVVGSQQQQQQAETVPQAPAPLMPASPPTPPPQVQVQQQQPPHPQPPYSSYSAGVPQSHYGQDAQRPPQETSYMPPPPSPPPAQPQDAAGLDSLLDEIMGGPATPQAPQQPQAGNIDLDSLLDDILGNNS